MVSSPEMVPATSGHSARSRLLVSRIEAFSYRGAQIVQHDPAGHATEELERRPMQAQPGGEALVEGQLGVLVPAARQRHDERPGAPQPIGLGIPIQAAEAEVDLRFLPRVDFEARRRARGRCC